MPSIVSNNEMFLSLTFFLWFNYLHQIWRMFHVFPAIKLTWSIHHYQLHQWGKNKNKKRTNFFNMFFSLSTNSLYLSSKQIKINTMAKKIPGFTDLSTPDSFYILPLVTGLTYWLTRQVLETFNVKKNTDHMVWHIIIQTNFDMLFLIGHHRKLDKYFIQNEGTPLGLPFLPCFPSCI